jgi:AraC-like DNA-binding protein
MQDNTTPSDEDQQPTNPGPHEQARHVGAVLSRQPNGLSPQKSYATQDRLIVKLGRTHATYAWKEGNKVRRESGDWATAWYVPAGVLHWTSLAMAAPFVTITLPKGLVAVMYAPQPDVRVVRLVDLVRMHWGVYEAAVPIETALRHHGAPTEQQMVEFGLKVIEALIGPAAVYRDGGLVTDRFVAIVDAIEVDLRKRLLRADVARAADRSLYHVARKFKERTGMTPREYITLRRCFEARKLIEAGVPLADAAVDVGFFDQAELTRKFVKVFGQPPGEFRNDSAPKRTRDQSWDEFL